jgi:hypothetical protein
MTPYFLRAYLVAEKPGAPPVGVVRKHSGVWGVFPFATAGVQEPREGFGSRHEAAARLLELASDEPGPR